MTRQPSLGRRRVLAALGSGVAVALAGCTGDNGLSLDGRPHYEEGTVPDVEGDERTAEELTAAESVAEQEVREGVTTLDVLEIVEHEFVLEEGFHGPTIQGTVENTGEDRADIVEIRVRVFNDEGNQLGRYIDSTGDLDGETGWEFQVVLLESPGDIANYDITTLGTPT